MSVPDSPASPRPPHISQAHWDELSIGSAIAPDVIQTRGYKTVPAHALPDVLFEDYQRRDGLMIPIWSTRGLAWSVQLKPDQPRSVDGRIVKYETAVKRPQCIDVPPACLPYLGDPATSLWITEGAKKVDSGVSNGIPCIIGLQGVYGWRGKNDRGGKTALTDWEDIALNGRIVVIAFDSDCMSKTQVRDALDRLAAFLDRRGAEVHYCLLPPRADGEKCGLDDFFASGRTYQDLCGFLVDKLPPLHDPDDELVPDIVRVSDVAAEEMNWLWPGWIPRNMMTILGGYGGDGKSTVMTSLIGALTNGGMLPDGTLSPETNVLMLSAEDDVAQAIRPRLDLHGADGDRVLVLKGTKHAETGPRWLDLRRDIAMMERVIERHDIGMVVIDPLSSYLPNADRNSEGDIRDALQPLLGLMERTGVGIVGIMHIGKSGDGRRASQRLLGSTAFTALARSVLMVADVPDEQQPDDVETGGKQKVLQVVKSNYAIAPPPQAFRRPLNAPIHWLGRSAITIEECFSSSTGKRGPSGEDRRDAAALIREMLAEGPVAAADIVEQTKALGISDRTLRRAKKELNILVKKSGYQGSWQWHLPIANAELKGVRVAP